MEYGPWRSGPPREDLLCFPREFERSLQIFPAPTFTFGHIADFFSCRKIHELSGKNTCFFRQLEDLWGDRNN